MNYTNIMKTIAKSLCMMIESHATVHIVTVSHCKLTIVLSFYAINMEDLKWLLSYFIWWEKGIVELKLSKAKKRTGKSIDSLDLDCSFCKRKRSSDHVLLTFIWFF